METITDRIQAEGQFAYRNTGNHHTIDVLQELLFLVVNILQ